MNPRQIGSLSIRWKLTLAIVLVATAVSISQITLFSVYDARTYLEYKRERTQELAEVVGANSASALTFGDKKDAAQILSSLRAEPSIRSAYLLEKNGGVLAEYLRTGETLSAPQVSLRSEQEYFDEDNYVLFHRIFFNGKQIGGLHLTSDLNLIKERKRHGLLLGGAVGSSFFAISILLALWLQRSFTRPIAELTSTMRSITERQDYSLRASSFSTDEFDVLARGFNYMLSEIEQRDKKLASQMLLLEQTNKELDQFVYVASHDLKAPLRAVDNLSRLIAKATADILPPEKREYLDLMQNRVKRMESLFDDLLLYSRIGRTETKTESVQLSVLLREVVELLAPPSGFTVVIPDGLPQLKTAKVPLEQVVRNLIGNAIKHHARTDGKITIAVRELVGELEFSLCDDGPGIPAEYHEKIFQMFQTLKPRDEVEGSGMGLALVKKIVENQGGRVWLDSSEGRGTCFYFTWKK